MEKKTPIQIVIDFMSKKKKPVAFSEIVELLRSKQLVKEEEFDEFINNFYDEMSFNAEFAFLGDNMWALANKVDFNDIKRAEYDEEDDNTDMIDSEEEEEENAALNANDDADIYNGEQIDITKQDDSEMEEEEEY